MPQLAQHYNNFTLANPEGGGFPGVQPGTITVQAYTYTPAQGLTMVGGGVQVRRQAVRGADAGKGGS
jgi:hypothetical protein